MTSIPVILRRRRRISVGPTGPTNTVAPVVSGTATVGQTLSTTNGTWTGEGTITYAYQWLDDGAAISGATSSTYTLTASEEGGNISCRVTATDDNGSTAATSNSLGPVAAATGAPLDLNFATGTYVDNASNTTLATIATFARSSSATYVDSSGVVQTASSGTIRDAHHEWNGSSWVRKGLLLETDAATNLLLNSGTLSTQNVTTSAQAYTLHFTGIGTITLSGTSTAGPLVGTGTGENNRVSLTFTPTAGTLTLTVAGTVTNAQLEAGSYRTSYIPTSGATATRAGETLSVNAAGVPWSTTAMSWVFEGEASYSNTGSTSEVQFFGKYVGGSQSIFARLGTAGGNTGLMNAFAENSGTIETANGPTGSQTTPAYRSTQKAGVRITTTDLQCAHNGTSGTNETAVGGTIDDFSAQELIIGGWGLTYAYNGTIGRLRMWDSDIGASELETETT